jgi:tetratricopeptide (TPR) repeat protein
MLVLALAGCAAMPMRSLDSGFIDAAFAPPSEQIRVEDIFATSPAMERYLKADIAAELAAKGKQKGLFDALYQRGELTLDYDATMTRNAAQAFEAKSGNCLSLVILTAAFARRLDLAVHYQRVFLDESWTRSNGLEIFNEHVNVTLGGPLRPGARPGDLEGQGLTIDFVPADELAKRRTRVISEQTLVSMYFNNRATELLGAGQLDRAYWWARAAIVNEPTYLPAHNTLGVIYKQHGNLREALSVFNAILAVEPENFISMTNQLLVLRAMDRSAEAAVVEARLKQIRPVPPFHYFDLGVAAMRRDDFTEGKRMFAKAIQRDAFYDKFHFWLALAHYHLGELDEARKQLKIAQDTSTTRSDRALYSETLARLSSGQAIETH